MRVALVAHDKKKDQIVNFAMKYKDILSKHKLCATGTTGKLIAEKTGMEIEKFLSGPLGGDQQIGSRIACDKLDFVIFLRDPMTSQPHEPDILALIRLCDVHNIPVATNIVTAEILLNAIDKMDFRNDVKYIKKEYF